MGQNLEDIRFDGELFLEDVLEKLHKKMDELKEDLTAGEQEIRQMHDYYWENYTEMDQYGYENFDSDDDDDGNVDVPYGEVTCLTGEFEGGTFEVEDSLVIGKDARQCNVVLSNKTVSRVHCIIRYIPATDTYTVKDVSRNGTYFNNGQRLTKDYEMQVPRNTVIYIGKPQETFVLD